MTTNTSKYFMTIFSHSNKCWFPVSDNSRVVYTLLGTGLLSTTCKNEISLSASLHLLVLNLEVEVAGEPVVEW